MKSSQIYRDACYVVEKIKLSGFLAYFAGGPVRDMIMGCNSDDIDIATSAKPDEILSMFPKCYEIGAAFGIINVVVNETNFEVATFREERGYSDGRHPDEISYTDNPALDAKRRDFTINSMFYDPIEDQVLDFEGGQKDIEDKILRTVGDANARFSEDYLRILRAVRFATRFGFKLDHNIPEAISKSLDGLNNISNERIRDELNKMLTGSAPAEALKMLYELGILDVILPEISALVGVEQPKQYHPEGDVFVHTCLMLEQMEGASVELAWAVLLHDVGKPATFSIGEDGVEHFYCHDRVGREIAEKILKRFKFSNREIGDIITSVGNHMKFAHVKEMRESKLKRLMADASFPLQLELHKLDCSSSHGKLDNYYFLKERLDNPEIEIELPKPLITGYDLINLGFKPGRKMGELLQDVSDMHLEGKLTTKEEALEYVREKFLSEEENDFSS
jgi:poly(A) polymerase